MRRLTPLLIVICVGCAGAGPTTNPSFSISRNEARRQLLAETTAKARLERPLVILGGFFDVFGPLFFEQRLRGCFDGPILRITFADCGSFDTTRARTIDRIDRAFGVNGDDETVEVDVIGLSMGGLVAVHAAAPDTAGGKRLKIRNLYTLSSPLTGARRAANMPFDLTPMIRDMRPGSRFYDELLRQPIDYQVFSYTMLNDRVVGGQYASLPGRGVWWLKPSAFEPAHGSVTWDRRILLDLVRRLKNQPPIAQSPPAPLPEQE